MNKLIWIQELVSRLKKDRPEFFAKLQIYAVILLVICGAVEAVEHLKLYDLPDNIVTAAGYLISTLIGAGFVAQLPVNDNNAAKK